MSSLRIGVIGCGSIAQKRHLPEYAANPRAAIGAVCDSVPGRAQEAADRFGAPLAFMDYREVLEQADVDAVSICLPNYLHAKVAVEAFAAGKHVLCEKPMAGSVAEARRMVEAAAAAERVLMIGHNQRFMRVHQVAKQLVHSGRLGAVLRFATAFAHGGPEMWSIDGADSWFFRKQEAIFGALGDLGVHKADLMRWLLEDEVETVHGVMATLEKHGDVEDNAVCSVRMYSGAVGTIAASWTQHGGEDNATHLYCEHGTVHIGSDPAYPLVVRHDDGSVERRSLEGIATNDHQLASGVIDEFVDAVLSGRAPAVDGREGAASLAVIAAAVESSLTGRAVQPERV